MCVLNTRRSVQRLAGVLCCRSNRPPRSPWPTVHHPRFGRRRNRGGGTVPLGLRNFWPGVLLKRTSSCELQFFQWWVACGIALGQHRDMILTVIILKRFSVPAVDRRETRTLRLPLLACIAGMTVSSRERVILARPRRLTPPSEWVRCALAWWLGDTAGLLIVASAVAHRHSAQWNRSLVRTAASGCYSPRGCCRSSAFTNPDHRTGYNARDLPPFMLLIWIGMTEPHSNPGRCIVLTLVGMAGGRNRERRRARSTSCTAPPPSTDAVGASSTTAALIVLAMTSVLAERERAKPHSPQSVADYQAARMDVSPAAIVATPPRAHSPS